MQQHRASILHRPLKSVGKCTVESQEAEYQREQEKLAFKTTKSAATHDRITRSLYPTPADKQAAHQDTQQYLETHMIARMQEREATMQQDKKLGSQGAVQVVAVADERPWLSAGNMYRDAADEKAARRRCEEEVAAANRGYAASASLQRSREQAQEQQDARQALSSSNFWNMGSEPTDRFAPRLIRKGAVMPANATRAPPPWATYDCNPAPAAAPTTAARYATPPYSTHTTADMPATAVEPCMTHAGEVQYNPNVALNYSSAGRVDEAGAYIPVDAYASGGMYQHSNEGGMDDWGRVEEQMRDKLCLEASEEAVYGTAGAAAARVTAPAMTGMQAVLHHQVAAPDTAQSQQVGARYACRPASATRTTAPWATLADGVSDSRSQVSRAGFPTAPAPIYPTVPADMAAAGLPSNKFQRASFRGSSDVTTSVSEIMGGRAPAQPAGLLAARPQFPWN